MSQRALAPNVISYTAAMSACEKGGQWQRALEVLEGMPQRAQKPDVISYTAAMSACDKGGQTPHLLREAVAWHVNLEERGHMLKGE